MLDYDLAPAAPGKPTLLVLHGLGDSKFGWQPVAPMLDLEGWGWCFVNAPRPYHGGWSWFDLAEDLSVDGRQVAESLEKLRELVAHLGSVHGVSRLAVMGFSQGCLMALELALRAQRPCVAVVGISGWLHDPESYPAAFGAGARQQRLLVTHGTHDPLIPCALAAERIAYLRTLGIALDWRTYPKAHNLDDEDELPAIRSHLLDGERAWAHGPGPGETP